MIFCERLIQKWFLDVGFSSDEPRCEVEHRFLVKDENNCPRNKRYLLLSNIIFTLSIVNFQWPWRHPHHCGTTVFTLMYLNSSLNPLIYSWKIRGIRQAVVGILRNTFPYFWLKGGSRKESGEHFLFSCERQFSNTCKSPGGCTSLYKKLIGMCR